MTAAIISQQLLYAVKTGGPHLPFLQELAEKPNAELLTELMEINTRKAFWINLYNAFVQLFIKEQHPDLSTWRSRIAFFSKRNINISGNLISLNDIEHGMLRHSSIWWSFGYLKKIFVSNFEKQLRVPLDYRIHFALNCGAISCPVIAFYTPEKLDRQLDDAMKLFLEEEVMVDEQNNTVHLSSIFKWFRKDFGGSNGIIQLLWSQRIIPEKRNIRFLFKDYNWSIMSSNFSTKIE